MVKVEPTSQTAPWIHRADRITRQLAVAIAKDTALSNTSQNNMKKQLKYGVSRGLWRWPPSVQAAIIP